MKPEINDWYYINHPDVLNRLGSIRHVLFDFDGTLSVLRQGWEDVMIPVMIEAICGDTLPADHPAIEQEVREYVDRSTGSLTILQMEWLALAVRRHGLPNVVMTAAEYKRVYLDRLMISVDQRIEQLASGEVPASDHLVAGAREFVSGLIDRGAQRFLASGTDHAYVVGEARALGLLDCFAGHVYGALDNDENHAKERVIQRILDENNLSGYELLIVGDGPVEIREGIQRGALTLGVASDEVARQGWNPHKVTRVTNAEADLLVPDFNHTPELLGLLFTGPSSSTIPS